MQNQIMIETFEVGQLGCNCSIIWDEKTKEALIVDPGDEATRIMNEVASHGLIVKGLVHTHAHFDHVMASGELKRKWGVPIYLHKADQYLYDNLQMQGSMFGIQTPAPEKVDAHLKDEMEIVFGEGRIKTLFTPGHTPGSCCFHLEFADRSILFSGDTLFYRSIGRTDLWGGDYSLITKSIKNRLYTLDDDTQVVCGHGPDTKIGVEKRKNEFVKA